MRKLWKEYEEGGAALFGHAMKLTGDVDDRGKAGRSPSRAHRDGEAADILVAGGAGQFLRVHAHDVGAVLVENFGDFRDQTGPIAAR